MICEIKLLFCTLYDAAGFRASNYGLDLHELNSHNIIINNLHRNSVLMTFSLNLTIAAANRIQHLSSLENASYFRVRVDGGGCSGFQYKFDFDDKKQIDDIEIRAHGVVVLIDNMSQEFLQNSELDFVEEVVGSFFKVSNPNASASCGCGTSFSV